MNLADNRFVQFVKQLVARISRHDVPGLSAQLSYFFLLSLFPFMIFFVTLMGYLPFEDIDVINFLSDYAPADIVNLLNSTISEVMNNRNGGLLSIGIIGTLWSASNGINALIRSFNSAYDIEEARPFLIARGISIILTIAMIGVIIMAFALPIFGRMIGEYIFSLIGLSDGFVSLWNTLRWVVSSVVFFIVLIMLYKMAPSKHVYFRHTYLGALFATVFWQLTSLGFSYYVSNMANYSATYGSLGGVIIMMFWFYLSGIIIIVGGEINALFAQKKERKAIRASSVS
ncbi:YihY/virulence factor BrkB family protein [Gracilibacillus timonensis]|uniref:YihY/virulence factor BrkB family protein n=1 Tax=Gracilibacillus timonensis TaxID=1816696 RepID=UPI000A8FBFDC|nr:YihY/virulence factor BrkB family protein [Gracilibacillus timonensis]